MANIPGLRRTSTNWWVVSGMVLRQSRSEHSQRKGIGRSGSIHSRTAWNRQDVLEGTTGDRFGAHDL